MLWTLGCLLVFGASYAIVKIAEARQKAHRLFEKGRDYENLSE